jgi:hypothetical protein
VSSLAAADHHAAWPLCRHFHPAIFNV